MEQVKVGAASQGAAPIPIDILLPVHGKPDLTVKAVKHIYSYTRAPFHLIVLDDTDASIKYGSLHQVDPAEVTSPYFERFAKQHSNVTYHNHHQPFREGNEFFNVGFSYCKHDYVATIMNSVAVQPDWETHALMLFEQDPQIGIIGFKSLFPSGTIESAGIVFNGHLPCDFGRDAPGYYFTDDNEMQAVQWAFTLLRKKAVVGNLEEGVFHGFVGWDDIDNSFSVKAKGWKILYCGHGVGVHQPRATRGSDDLHVSLLNRDNSYTFFKRWGLWDKFQEGNKLDVKFKLRPETKAKLSAVVLELQVLQQFTQERQNILNSLGSEAMKELGVEPDKFMLDMNPQLDLWDLRLLADKGGNGDKPTESLGQTTEQVKGASPAQSQKRQKVKR